MKLCLAVIVSVALAVVAPSAASAQSPSAYRTQLNRHCRTFTPKFKRIEADLKKAVSTKDPKLLAYALGQGLALNLKQDAYIERVPVPAAMRTQMLPTFGPSRMRHSPVGAAKSSAETLRAFVSRRLQREVADDALRRQEVGPSSAPRSLISSSPYRL
jgi:hypothetical protein